MREADLKTALAQRIQSYPGYYVIPHQDIRKSGIPDLSVHGHGRSSYYEIKHAVPTFDTRGIQEYVCQKLAQCSLCRYIIYHEQNGVKTTVIAHPKDVAGRKGILRQMPYELTFEGHNHDAVARYVRDLHEGVMEINHALFR